MKTHIKISVLSSPGMLYYLSCFCGHMTWTVSQGFCLERFYTWFNAHHCLGILNNVLTQGPVFSFCTLPLFHSPPPMVFTLINLLLPEILCVSKHVCMYALVWFLYQWDYSIHNLALPFQCCMLEFFTNSLSLPSIHFLLN